MWLAKCRVGFVEFDLWGFPYAAKEASTDCECEGRDSVGNSTESTEFNPKCYYMRPNFALLKEWMAASRRNINAWS